MQQMTIERKTTPGAILTTRAVLALEDGAIFEGRAFGAVAALDGPGRRGEVVFTTAMTGYQEVCTDPSYRGQMVVMTYPLIGNYGVASVAEESRRPWLSVLIVREYCDEYSNWRATESLNDFLCRHGIPGLAEIDTRALTRHLRDHGTLRGVVRSLAPDEVIDREALVTAAQSVRTVTELDVVNEVSITDIADLTPDLEGSAPLDGLAPVETKRVVLIDTGYKQHIATCLAERNLDVVIVPHNITMERLLDLQPDGVALSNGPGDPETVTHLIALTRELMQRKLPIMGICLGHQVIGLAAGAKTSRLPFGHHGCNHPVLE
ncbi:MAG TPA: glutamine-hydrolyzing carbamoyl-phosphate synthase small subunit, partial [Ktedonobacterales bacterium]|nr:glutamine-hydrolyzing carbamoyl-phosphate synthase small subunit [Ktedonobacterales bacterium]